MSECFGMELDKTNDSLKFREQKHLQNWTSKGARLSENVQAKSERSVRLPTGQNPWATDLVWTKNQIEEVEEQREKGQKQG